VYPVAGTDTTVVVAYLVTAAVAAPAGNAHMAHAAPASAVTDATLTAPSGRLNLMLGSSLSPPLCTARTG
jgi:hypothetical protein